MFQAQNRICYGFISNKNPSSFFAESFEGFFNFILIFLSSFDYHIYLLLI